MKKYLTLIFTMLLTAMSASSSEELHFDNETYNLKFSAMAEQTQGYGNEYFRGNEDVSNWTKMLGIYSYPKENNPIKFAENFNKTIENTENSVFLKLVENKDANKAVLSFLVNGTQKSRKYFEYDLYKFEKQKSGGMVVLKYASKHYFKDNKDIEKIAQNIKKDNDKYIEMFIVSQTPIVISKDMLPQ